MARIRLAVNPLEGRLTPTSLALPPGGIVSSLTLAETPLDPAYGVNGRADILLDPYTALRNNALLAVPAAGGTTLAVAQRDGRAVIERRLADGKPDPTFGTGGRADLSGAFATDIAALAATPGGGAVVLVADRGPRVGTDTATGPATLKLLRVAADGTAASSEDRPAVSLPFGQPGKLAVAADGTIAVSYATADGRLGVLRLAPDGTAAGFGRREFTAAELGLQPASLVAPAPSVAFRPGAVAFTRDGGLAVAATAVTTFAADVAPSNAGFVLKLTAGGDRDGGFGNGGVAYTPSGGTTGNPETADWLAARTDGSLLVGGSFYGTTWYVSRLDAAGQFDPAFTDISPLELRIPEAPRGVTGAGVLLDWAVLADGRVVGLVRQTIYPVAPGTPDGLAVRSIYPAPQTTYLLVVIPAGGGAEAETTLVLTGTPRTLAVNAGGVLVGIDGYALVRPQTVAGLPGGLIVDPPPERPTYTLTTAGPRLTVNRLVGGDAVVPGASFAPFEASYTGTLNAVLADVDGDGTPEVVVAPEDGGGPVVAVFRVDGTELARFYGIEDRNFRGGARVAAGDIDGDGTSDVVVTPGVGGGPRVAVWDGKALRSGPRRLVNDFFAFEEAQRGGATVAVAPGGQMAFGAGVGGGPRVTVLDGRELVRSSKPTVLADRFVGDPSGRDGARLRLEGRSVLAAAGRDPRAAFEAVFVG